MKCLYKQALIWIGNYFPSIPRLFGLKILTIGYTDITPDISRGSRPNGKIVEPKISWLVKSGWHAPLPIKIVMSCVQEADVWAQAYPVNRDLHGGWDRDVSCGGDTFDPELRQKCKNTIVPPKDFLKIDHFAAQNPHPSYRSNLAFKIIPHDSDVIVIHRNFLNQKAVKGWHWFMRFLIGVAGLAIIGGVAMYFWVKFCVPVWHHFFR